MAQGPCHPRGRVRCNCLCDVRRDSFCTQPAGVAGARHLHRHPYEEIFITLEGEARVVANEQELVVAAGDVLIVPPHTPHAFTNSGTGPLRQIDIHVSPTFSTEWL